MPTPGVALVLPACLVGRGRTIQGTILGAPIITTLFNGMNRIGLDPCVQNIVRDVVLALSVVAAIDRKKIGIIR